MPYTVRLSPTGDVTEGPRTDDPDGIEITEAQYQAICAERAAGNEAARINPDGSVTGKKSLWQARLAMADKYHQQPVAIRNRYRGVFNDINQAFQRGDVELARYSLENMTVQPGDEQLHAEFLALFPN